MEGAGTMTYYHAYVAPGLIAVLWIVGLAVVAVAVRHWRRP